MVALIKIGGHLIGDALRWLVLLFRSTESVHAENLLLRRRLAWFIERGVRPRRVDVATRVRLSVLVKVFEWRSALVVVQARDHDPVASRRLEEAAVALEVLPGAPVDCRGAAGADPQDGYGEPAGGELLNRAAMGAQEHLISRTFSVANWQ